MYNVIAFRRCGQLACGFRVSGEQGVRLERTLQPPGDGPVSVAQTNLTLHAIIVQRERGEAARNFENKDLILRALEKSRENL